MKGRLDSSHGQHNVTGDETQFATFTYCNGPLNVNVVSHYEVGCGKCSCRETALENVFAAMVTDRVLLGSDVGQPSKNRWGTCSEARAKSTAGTMM